MRTTVRSLIPLACSFAIAAGCGDAAPTDSIPATAAAAAHGSAVVWSPCPDDSAYALDPSVECATIPMPLDHAHPEAGTFPFFVARKRSGKPKAAQLWMLDGGPGSSGEELFYSLLGKFARAMPDVDFYVPAHRGTGRSAGLVCSGEAHDTPRDVELSPEEWQACAAEVSSTWGSKLGLFDTTQAAEDVGAAVDLTRDPGQRVFVYGLSYGTYLGLRYLDRFPHQADGVILDSVVSPGSLWISEADTYFDPVLHRYADLCKADATCAARMGPDPWARLHDIYAAVDAGHCAEAGIDRPKLRQIAAGMLMSWSARMLALAVPYRLDRCTSEDVTALQAMSELWFSPYDLDGFSHALESNISFSELWESPAPSPAAIRARADGALASLDWATERADVYGFWPKYAPDAYQLAWPKTNVPMLMLNGTLDGETPIETALVAASHYDGPHQHFVVLPNAPHGGGYQSPTTLPDRLPCGIKIMASFVADPKAAPDTSCIAAMQPVAFESAAMAAAFFGTTSVWDNDPVPPEDPTAPPAPAKRRAKRRAILLP